MFLINKWQFDAVMNQWIALPVMNLGTLTGTTLDKGALEIFGSKGISDVLSKKTLPTLKQIQSGAVQDYALVFQVLVILGISFLMIPGFLNAEALNLKPFVLALFLAFTSFILSSQNLKQIHFS